MDKTITQQTTGDIMNNKMKRAVLWSQQEIRIEEIDIPKPKKGEVLIKNAISTTCGTDVKNYKRGYPLVKPPHPYGHEFSGTIAELGKDVKKFKIGDRVAVHNSAPCNECFYCKKGLYSICENPTFNRGAYAEYTVVPESIVKQNMFIMPDDMDFKTASLLEPFACAVYGIDNCPIEMGDTVVINGAGPIGLMFARLAVLRGSKVIVTDLKDNRLETARRLGAWKTLNLSDISDPVNYVRSFTENSRGADVVIEATGLIQIWENSIKMVRKGGFVLVFGGTKSGSTLNVDAVLMHYSQITIKGVFHTTPKHVAEAFELLKMRVIKAEDFIQHEYQIDHLEEAILEHASGDVIKNCIIYD